MQKFLARSLFLVLLLSAAESWALPECTKKSFLTGTNKTPFPAIPSSITSASDRRQPALQHGVGPNCAAN